MQAIAALTEKSVFEAAVKTVNTALEYEVVDNDSLINLHSRLHGNVVYLDPVRLPDQVSQLEKYKPNLAAYDKILRLADGSE